MAEKSGEVGQIRTSRTRANDGRNRSSLAESGPKLAEVGPKPGEIARIRPGPASRKCRRTCTKSRNPHQISPNVGQVRSKSREWGRSRANFNRNRAKCRRHRPQSWPNPANFSRSLNFAEALPRLDTTAPHPGTKFANSGRSGGEVSAKFGLEPSESGRAQSMLPQCLLEIGQVRGELSEVMVKKLKNQRDADKTKINLSSWCIALVTTLLWRRRRRAGGSPWAGLECSRLGTPPTRVLRGQNVHQTPARPSTSDPKLVGLGDFCNLCSGFGQVWRCWPLRERIRTTVGNMLPNSDQYCPPRRAVGVARKILEECSPDYSWPDGAPEFGRNFRAPAIAFDETWPRFAEFGRSLTKSGQHQLDLGKSWPKCWPSLVDCGRRAEHTPNAVSGVDLGCLGIPY